MTDFQLDMIEKWFRDLPRGDILVDCHSNQGGFGWIIGRDAQNIRHEMEVKVSELLSEIHRLRRLIPPRTPTSKLER